MSDSDETFQNGQKHLVKCRCVLQQYKSLLNPPQHQFVVFSKMLNEDTVVSKYAQCNNCGIIHKVTNICTSEIIAGKESMQSIVSIDDIRATLPPNLANILDRNNVDLPTWEQAQFILENKQWGNFVILSQDEDAGTKQGKYLRILGETLFNIETYSREDILRG
jgi:hypothetical protein